MYSTIVEPGSILVRASSRVLLFCENSVEGYVFKLGVATPHLHIHLHPFTRDTTRQEIFLTLAGR